MICYDRIDISERNDVNKTSATRECDVCHYWYFLNYSFKLQPNVCNRCHDLLMMSVNLYKVSCGKTDLNISMAMKMLKISSLCIFLAIISVYRKDFDETKHVFVLIKDYKLLKKI